MSKDSNYVPNINGNVDKVITIGKAGDVYINPKTNQPEKIYLNENNVLITDARVQLLDIMYPLKNIGSVTLKTQSPSSCLQVMGLLIGFPMAGCGGLAFFSALADSDIELAIPYFFLVILGTAIIVYAFKTVKQMANDYVVRINDIKAFSTKDKDFGERIVEAMNLAISKSR